MFYYCKCGCYFGKRIELASHIGICNPTWPRTNPDDEHAVVSKQEWHDKRNAAYRKLREG